MKPRTPEGEFLAWLEFRDMIRLRLGIGGANFPGSHELYKAAEKIEEWDRVAQGRFSETCRRIDSSLNSKRPGHAGPKALPLVKLALERYRSLKCRRVFVAVLSTSRNPPPAPRIRALRLAWSVDHRVTETS